MRLSAITDEVGADLDAALRTCEAAGITAAEIRTVDGRNIVHHDSASVARVRSALSAGGFECPVVDSPFLKTDVGDVVWDDLERGFEVAHALGARAVRVFSGLRTEDPATVLPWLATVLEEALDRADAAGLRLALEVEHVCNVATGVEAARLLEHLGGDALGVVWDPGNEAMFVGGRPDPAGLELVDGRIVHVHVKDAAGESWVRPGDGDVGWEEELRALAARGYAGFLSLEPHYSTDSDGLEGAGREAAQALRDLAARAGVTLR